MGMEREHLEAEMAVDEEILEIEIDAVLVEEEGLETGTENAIVASEVVVDVLMEAITEMAEVVIEDIEGILEEIAKNIHDGMIVIVDQEVDHISCTNSRKILPFAD